MTVIMANDTSLKEICSTKRPWIWEHPANASDPHESWYERIMFFFNIYNPSTSSMAGIRWESFENYLLNDGP